MAIKSLNGIRPRETKFTTDGEDVWEVIGMFDLPSLTIENIKTGEQMTGAIGCLNFDPFVQLVPDGPVREKIEPIYTEGADLPFDFGSAPNVDLPPRQVEEKPETYTWEEGMARFGPLRKPTDLPPRASWGDSDPRVEKVEKEGRFVWNEKTRSLDVKLDGGTILQCGDGDARLEGGTEPASDPRLERVGPPYPPFCISSLPPTLNPSLWLVTPVVGGLVFIHPEIIASKLYDAMTGELSSLPTTERDARLVDRSRR